MSKTTNKFTAEVRQRAVRVMLDHQRDHPPRWAAIDSLGAKIGGVPQTPREEVKKTSVNCGNRAGIPPELADKIKAVKRELRQAKEILREPLAYFSQAELKRPLRR